MSTQKNVFLSISTDIIHGGHIRIIEQAAELGVLTVGVLTDKAVASYKRFPILPFEEREKIIASIKGVNRVVAQESFIPDEYLLSEKPDYLVHGDDWKTGMGASLRTDCIKILQTYGGSLIEFPYSDKPEYMAIEAASREQLSIPDIRRGRLRRLINLKGLVTAIESHSGLTGLIAENTIVYQNGNAYQFDAMWVSSLCDSIAKGKPDIELVDMTSRLRTIDDIMDVTTKPIIVDGDTGGQLEHFIYNVKTMERIGVSAVIIEDKTGLKKNSLFGTEVEQIQDSIECFSAKIAAGKQVQKTKEFMIIARVESLILEQGMEDALKRAFAYAESGADGIMIHSRKKEPDEIFEFITRFRSKNQNSCLVVVPTSFNTVYEDEFKRLGVNIVIYANQLTRSGVPAMQQAARMILENHRAKEADDICMPIKEIITMIPEK